MDAVLFSLVTLDKGKPVNIDIKPDNILLSNVDIDYPIIKIGDLGLLRPDGFATLLNRSLCALLRSTKASAAFTAPKSGHSPRHYSARLSLVSLGPQATKFPSIDRVSAS